MNSINDLIKFYEKIPAERWIEGEYKDSDGCHCAVGHLAYSEPFGGDASMAENVLNSLFKDAPFGVLNLIQINDGEDNRYNQDSPKERTLAFLKDLLDK